MRWRSYDNSNLFFFFFSFFCACWFFETASQGEKGAGEMISHLPSLFIKSRRECNNKHVPAEGYRHSFWLTSTYLRCWSKACLFYYDTDGSVKFDHGISITVDTWWDTGLCHWKAAWRLTLVQDPAGSSQAKMIAFHGFWIVVRARFPGFVPPIILHGIFRRLIDWKITSWRERER